MALDHESPGVRHIAYEGKHIAYLASSESAPLHLAVIPFACGEPEKTFALPATTRPNLVGRMSWAPDGQLVWSLTGNGLAFTCSAKMQEILCCKTQNRRPGLPAVSEARAVLALNHPNIVTVYEIGHEADAQFIASEFVKGDTLRERMAGAPLKVGEALEIAVQVASALAGAYQEGVVHRDIKPENIMLRPDGYVKVLDFGIAKLTEPQVPSSQTEAPTLMKIQTRPGMVLGSAHYMSPEQARGLPVDDRTDIWSLGVVLYEMIAGRVPFDGQTPSDCIAAILDKEPPPLIRFAPDVPDTLDLIVSTALTKDREERYHSIKELLGALRRLKQRLDASAELERSAPPQSSGLSTASGSGEAVARLSGEASATQPITHSTSSAEYIATTIKRHKTAAALALVTLVVVLVGGGFALYKLLTRTKTDATLRAPKFTALTT